MSNRKESLLKTLKLQNEQLEQWEHKRTISRDPDEKLLCDDKIEDIKALIKQNETELKKLKGGKDHDSSTSVNHQGMPYIGHNQIGFNADIAQNESQGNISDYTSAGNIGDEIDPEDKKAVAGITNTSINIPPIPPKNDQQEYSDEGGKRPQKRTRSHKQQNVTEAMPNNKLLAFFFGMGAMGILISTILDLGIHGIRESLTGKIVAFALTVFLLWVIYIRLNGSRGLKLALSVLVLCSYAAYVFWDVVIFGKGEGAKSVGEVVIIPLIIITIGSIYLLINEKNESAETAPKKK